MRILFAIAIGLIGSQTFAHDLWLIPPARTEVGREVLIRLNSGMEFPVSEYAPDATTLLERRVILPDGKEMAATPAGIDGLSGLMKFTPASPGIFVIGTETPTKQLNLPADEFNHYLVSDGLPHIYLLRFKERTLDKPGKEQYSKSPKCLLRIGNGPGDATRTIGLPLEITPLKDPFAVKPGDALPVRVQFRGKPLADAHLGWSNPGDGLLQRGTTRTNEKGEALIPIGKTGLTCVRLTHMTHPNTAEYEWESFWTNLVWRLDE